GFTWRRFRLLSTWKVLRAVQSFCGQGRNLHQTRGTFGKQPFRHNTLGTMMQTISEQAGLSRRYHCINVTELHNAGFSLEDIGHVTGHRILLFQEEVTTVQHI
ncbi:hypothetical protein BOX15_Mlig016443g1, partial [Macrostomum lignano]